MTVKPRVDGYEATGRSRVVDSNQMLRDTLARLQMILALPSLGDGWARREVEQAVRVIERYLSG